MNLASYSLSKSDLKRIFPNVNIITMDDIGKYWVMDDNNNLHPHPSLFGQAGACILLYLTSKNRGHWCLLRHLSDNTLEFFDSYGILLDDQYEYTDYQSGYQIPSLRPLTRFIVNSNYKNVISNDEQLQSKKKNINTCGRWVIMRMLFDDIPLQEFTDIIKKIPSNKRDLFVVEITNQIIH